MYLEKPEIFILCFVAFLLFVGPLAGYYGSKSQCEARWPQKYKPQFTFITGCTIEHNGNRIPAENFRAF